MPLNLDRVIDAGSAQDGRAPVLEGLTALRLRDSVLWNLLGQGSPLVVALIAIPILIGSLGPDRFGILALAYTLIGYFGLFDLGMGRALTQMLAGRLGNGRAVDNGRLAWTSLITMFVFSSLVALCAAPAAEQLVSVLKLPVGLRSETQSAFLMLLLAIPIVVTTAGLRGILEAYQRFRALNAARIPLGASVFVAPLCVLPFSHSLTPVIAALLLTRAAAAGVFFYLCVRTLPSLKTDLSFRWQEALMLLRVGGWMMLSNLIGPLLMYIDRFVVGILVSTAAVAYYATPYEAVSKVLVIPAALAGVLFPAFATLRSMDQKRASRVYILGLKYSFLILLPLIFATVAFSSTGLTLWLGTDFAAHSSLVLQLLAIGVLVSGFGQVSFALIQGFGRPDLAAKLELVELPIYLVAIWVLVSRYGIAGAAAAWLIRAIIDAGILFVFSVRLTKLPSHQLIAMAKSAGVAAALMILAMAPFSGLLSVAVPVIVLAGYAFIVPRLMLSPAERGLALSSLPWRTAGAGPRA